MEVPDHDLEPPKFSRRALERLLNDWAAVRAMIMTGHKEEVPPSSASTDEINFMQYQGHTTHLDKFTYCLLVKLATQVRVLFYFLVCCNGIVKNFMANEYLVEPHSYPCDNWTGKLGVFWVFSCP